MKKTLVTLLFILFLNGCAQTTSMMGPTYTMVKTGSIFQTGTSVATSYGVKQALGQSPSESPETAPVASTATYTSFSPW